MHRHSIYKEKIVSLCTSMPATILDSFITFVILVSTCNLWNFPGFTAMKDFAQAPYFIFIEDVEPAKYAS